MGRGGYGGRRKKRKKNKEKERWHVVATWLDQKRGLEGRRDRGGFLNFEIVAFDWPPINRKGKKNM